MGMRPQDEPWGAGESDPGELYGQPFDPAASNPAQQPPPPGWEQGTWTTHAGPAATGGSRTWQIVGVAALCLVAIAVVVVMLA